MSPYQLQLASPILIEIPHIASMNEEHGREIVILRSETGISWKEHNLEATNEIVRDVFENYFGNFYLLQKNF